MTRCEAFSAWVSIKLSTLTCELLELLRWVKLNIDLGRALAGMAMTEFPAGFISGCEVMMDSERDWGPICFNECVPFPTAVAVKEKSRPTKDSEL